MAGLADTEPKTTRRPTHPPHSSSSSQEAISGGRGTSAGSREQGRATAATGGRQRLHPTPRPSGRTCVGIAAGASTGAQGANTATATKVPFDQARPEKQHGEGKTKKKNEKKSGVVVRTLRKGIATRAEGERRGEGDGEVRERQKRQTMRRRGNDLQERAASAPQRHRNKRERDESYERAAPWRRASTSCRPCRPSPPSPPCRPCRRPCRRPTRRPRAWARP